MVLNASEETRGCVDVCVCVRWSQEVTEEVVGSPIPEPRQRSRLFRSQSESSDDLSELDLSHGKKDAFVLEVCVCVCLGAACFQGASWVCAGGFVLMCFCGL